MRPDHQRGFALVSAIFLLVVLAALGGFIVTVATTQHTAAALDVLGAHAYRAAHAGIEWGLSRVKTDNGCSKVNGKSFAVDSMTVTMGCSAISGGAIENGLGYIYTITAIACNVPTLSACPGDATAPNYVERGLSVNAEM